MLLNSALKRCVASSKHLPMARAILQQRFQTGGFQAPGTEKEAQLTKEKTCIS
jgi:hypothetical protein